MLELDGLAAQRARILAGRWPLDDDLEAQECGLTDFRVVDLDAYYIRISEQGVCGLCSEKCAEGMVMREQCPKNRLEGSSNHLSCRSLIFSWITTAVHSAKIRAAQPRASEIHGFGRCHIVSRPDQGMQETSRSFCGCTDPDA